MYNYSGCLIDRTSFFFNEKSPPGYDFVMGCRKYFRRTYCSIFVDLRSISSKGRNVGDLVLSFRRKKMLGMLHLDNRCLQYAD